MKFEKEKIIFIFTRRHYVTFKEKPCKAGISKKKILTIRTNCKKILPTIIIEHLDIITTDLQGKICLLVCKFAAHLLSLAVID